MQRIQLRTRFSTTNPITPEHILTDPTIKFSLVHKDSVCIALLLHLKTPLKIDISACPLIDQTYYRVSNDVIHFCRQRLALLAPYTIQKFFRSIITKRRLALAMALHARLGASSPLGALPEDLLLKLMK